MCLISCLETFNFTVILDKEFMSSDIFGNSKSILITLYWYVNPITATDLYIERGMMLNY